MRTAISRAQARAPTLTDRVVEHDVEPVQNSLLLPGRERLGHSLDVLARSAAYPIQLEKNRKRWTPQQHAQSQKFWNKKHAREERRNHPRFESHSAHAVNHDSYRQFWSHPRTPDHQYQVSSGHGYRREHRVGGPDITQLAGRHEIESAIVHHLSSHIDSVPLGQGGERQVPVQGQNVSYRFRRDKDDRQKTGIGTYFLP